MRSPMTEYVCPRCGYELKVSTGTNVSKHCPRCRTRLHRLPDDEPNP